ncbi:acyltransferase [Streptomyces sp. NPDC094049]|uniref:acyltransferase family protein n=1 Tax=Streptomyces sp. NPDC094049 TaxID=3154987 RepID=UPI00331810C4
MEGLRGLAVLGVLLFHAGHFGGGFLGVDLFFVLSGFLITGLLLREARAADGRIRLAAFWGRRARRLVPALAVMIAGTLVLVTLFGAPSLRRQALDDTPWVLANLANWHFIAEQTGYWQASGTQVFSHLWSIAVEEQFYVVWPLLVALLVRVGGPGGSERLVAVAATTGALLSLALMITLVDPVDTTRVYEGTDTRAFSLLLGALAATEPASRLVRRFGERARTRWAAALAAAITAYWLTADGQGSPGLFQGGLFLHALAAALLIACVAHAPRDGAGHTPHGTDAHDPDSADVHTPDGAVAHAPDGAVAHAPHGAVARIRRGVVVRVLSVPPLRGLGLLSYSLYLWHWPVFLLLDEERLGLTGWSRTVVLLAVSLAAALLSKLLVEDPVRFRAPWAYGRTGAVALLGTLAALLALWAFLPRPQLGAGTVDITRLSADGSAATESSRSAGPPPGTPIRPGPWG